MINFTGFTVPTLMPHHEDFLKVHKQMFINLVQVLHPVFKVLESHQFETLQAGPGFYSILTIITVAVTVESTAVDFLTT